MGAVRISTTARLQSIKDVTPYSLWSAREAAKDERRTLCQIRKCSEYIIHSAVCGIVWSLKHQILWIFLSSEVQSDIHFSVHSYQHISEHLLHSLTKISTSS